MPRKGPAPRRELMPDPIYRSVLVTQIVNKVLQRGKRSLAERIVYDALDDHQGEDRRRADRHAQAGHRERQARSSRSRAAASVAPPTRSPSRSGPAGPTRSPSAGWSATPASAARRPWPSAWPTSCSTPPTASAPRSSAGRTCRRWPSPTRPSPTTAGSRRPRDRRAPVALDRWLRTPGSGPDRTTRSSPEPASGVRPTGASERSSLRTPSYARESTHHG